MYRHMACLQGRLVELSEHDYYACDDAKRPASCWLKGKIGPAVSNFARSDAFLCCITYIRIERKWTLEYML